ncbi:hypothetical protein HYT17_00295 [Candidatus Microgenomates bacterium]|nr:hypothetical protein [Candidatus Microgenomates bacterium]
MKNQINLLPQRSPEAIVTQKRRQRNVILFAALAFLVFLVWTVLFFWMQQLKKEENVLQNALSDKQKNITLLSERERLLRIVFNKAAAASIILKDQEVLSLDITSLKEILTTGVIIKNFNISAKETKITVISPDISSAIDFVRNLEEKSNANFLTKLVISSISQSADDTYEITIEGVLSHANK